MYNAMNRPQPRRRLRGALGSLLGALLLLGPAGPAAAQVALKVGEVTNWNNLPVHLANELGLYRAEGLDVKVTSFEGGAPMYASFAAGDTHAVLPVLSAFIRLKARGGPGIGTMMLVEKTFYSLVVRKELPIRSIADLKGRKIGITAPGAGSDFTMRAILQDFKLRPMVDTILVNLGGISAQFAAIQKGEVDGIMVAQPHIARAEKEGFGRVLVDMPSQYPNFDPIMVIFNESFLRQHGDAARRFNGAVLKALDYVKQNRSQAAAAAAKYYGGDPELNMRALEYEMRIWTTSGDFNMKAIDETMEWLLRLGLKQRIPTEKLITREYLPRR